MIWHPQASKGYTPPHIALRHRICCALKDSVEQNANVLEPRSEVDHKYLLPTNITVLSSEACLDP